MAGYDTPFARAASLWGAFRYTSGLDGGWLDGDLDLAARGALFLHRCGLGFQLLTDRFQRVGAEQLADGREQLLLFFFDVVLDGALEGRDARIEARLFRRAHRIDEQLLDLEVLVKGLFQLFFRLLRAHRR